MVAPPQVSLVVDLKTRPTLLVASTGSSTTAPVTELPKASMPTPTAAKLTHGAAVQVPVFPEATTGAAAFTVMSRATMVAAS